MPEEMIAGLPGGPEKAFASGVRSAVLKIDGEWFRLKVSDQYLTRSDTRSCV